MNEYEKADPALVALVEAVEAMEREGHEPIEERHPKVLLCIRGMLIGGEIVSGETYRKEFLAQAGITEEPSAEPAPASAGRNFIHLRNARFYVNTSPVPGGDDGFLWRGRLAAMDGFSIGSMEPQSVSIGPVVADVLGGVFDAIDKE